MFLIKAFLIVVIALSLWIAFVPSRHHDRDDHLGMRQTDSHVGPSLFIAVVCGLALWALNGG